MDEGLKVKVNLKATIQKYPEGATQEDIDNGLVEPYEVIVSLDEIDDKTQVQEILNKFYGGKLNGFNKRGS